ncbi:MAG: MFS transporter [Acidovorax sp.]
MHAVFWALVPVMLLGAADQAIVAPALGVMATTFNSRDDIVWVVTVYLLSAIADTPLAGRLSDIHGRWSVVLGALALFLAGGLLCGSAPTLGSLLVGRAIQGFGGGALIALPNAIVADLLSPRERGRYQAYISGTNAMAGLASPLVGAFLSSHGSWRWIFWLQMPLVMIAAAACWCTLGDRSAGPRRGGLDPLGVALMSAATACLLLALSWAGRRIGWTQLPNRRQSGRSSGSHEGLSDEKASIVAEQATLSQQAAGAAPVPADLQAKIADAAARLTKVSDELTANAMNATSLDMEYDRALSALGLKRA